MCGKTGQFYLFKPSQSNTWLSALQLCAPVSESKPAQRNSEVKFESRQNVGQTWLSPGLAPSYTLTALREGIWLEQAGSYHCIVVHSSGDEEKVFHFELVFYFFQLATEHFCYVSGGGSDRLACKHITKKQFRWKSIRCVVLGCDCCLSDTGESPGGTTEREVWRHTAEGFRPFS